MSRRALTRPLAAAAASALGLVASAAATAPTASAETTVPTPAFVSVGDSYISGEGGRWAGNSNSSSASVDALGPTAYFDNATRTAETIDRCHRSASAEIGFGSGTTFVNLACSGALSMTTTNSSGYFKPGLDFYDDGAGRRGQAALLRDYAKANSVKMVAVSVGGNDFDFPSIVQTCVTNFLGSSSLWPNYCNDDAAVSMNFTATNVAAVQARIVTGLQNVRQAMRDAGYADGSWSLVVQTYPSPLPKAAGIRYAQSGYTRQNTGGCGFWNKDADWANDIALAKINATVRAAAQSAGIANTSVLDLSHALDGRRLCETGVGLREDAKLASWQSAGAVDKTEWVDQIRTASTVFGPYTVAESFHPNYWGQLALRSCLRQAWNGGAVTGGTCARTGTGLVAGEPVMTLG